MAKLLNRAVPLIVVSFLSCCWFANSWISATISQLLGQIMVTAMIVIHYKDAFDFIELIIPIINFNAGLLLVPIFYRGVDWFDRSLVFLKWQIRSELENWKHLISSLPIGSFIVEGNRLCYVNKTAQEILGEGLILISPKCEIGDNEEYKELKEKLRYVVCQDGESWSLHDLLFNGEATNIKNLSESKYFYKKDLTNIKPLAVSITRLALGEDTMSVVVLQDLTIYEELNKEKAYREYQKLFFAMITHELRNPLQGILGIFQLLQPCQQTEDLFKQCALGLNTGKSMLCLIQDILDLSQLEANKFSLSEEVFYPAEVISECTEVMEFQYEKKRVELSKEINCDSNLVIKNDKTRYKQVIFNLLGNSLKFTCSGWVKVSLSYEGNILTTTVKDTGIGIKEEEQERLFQMYGKMESTKKVNPQGVGFGLHICKKLTQAMGGDISVVSKYEKGSAFTFTILNRIDNTIALNSRIGSDLRTMKGKILVVDDETICGYVLAKMIKLLGHEADIAYSAKEAIQKVEEERSFPYDIIFTDINMPGMNGYELSIEMKRIFSENNCVSPCIIGLTGDNTEAVRKYGTESGMSCIMTKPVDKDRLKMCLEEYICK